MAEQAAVAERKKVSKNEKVGMVTSTKMAKYIVVEVTRRVPHPMYKRIVSKKKKFYAHDEKGTAKMGDVVRIVEHRPLASEVAARLVRGLREAAPGITFAVERELAFSREAAFELNPEWPVPEHDVHADPLTLVSLPATKLVLRHPAMPHAQLLALATALAGADASVTHSSEAIVEISATGANKAAALAELCRDLDVPSEAVVAFGDMPNDLAMLRFAGLGVAVANAHPDVLAAADEITAANDEDGVALVLERLLAQHGVRS